MGWSTFAIIAVIVWGVVTVWTQRHDRELGVTRDEDGNPVFPPRPPVDPAAQAEIADLRQRVAVLERIVTDSNSRDASETARLAAEIDRLRGDDGSCAPPNRQLSEPAD